jgi:hypothetical protein
MTDWRSRLNESLLGPAGSSPQSRPEPGVLLEIVLGQARAELTYVLELGKTHSLPVTGSVTTDDMWIRVGATTLRFNYSRRAGVIVASVIGREDQQLRYNADTKAVVTPDGEPLDATAYVRDAIDATVNAWKASGKPDITISMLRSERPPMPTLPDSSEILPKS